MLVPSVLSAPVVAASDPACSVRAARQLTVHVDGRWFQVDDGPVVSCKQFRLLWRLLLALASDRLASPGMPVTAAALVAAGWPSERIFPRAARNRLHVALHRLRRLGLDGVVCCVPGGWLVARDVTLTLSDGDHATVALGLNARAVAS